MSVDDRLDAVLNTLADRVRRLRRERDLSVTALSYEAGISESRVRAIESGRTTASLATLVALAEAFEIDLSELFGETARDRSDREPKSPYVVPSEVTWGGDLPPAPWMTSAAPAPASSPHVVPSEVIWGGELPAAPWVRGTPAPQTTSVTPPRADPAPASPPIEPTEKSWGGALPPAPWMGSAPAATTVVSSASTATIVRTEIGVAPPAPLVAESDAPPPTSRYVLVAQDAGVAREPRTFSDLREGVLAGREFRSLREFAVAAVAEADYDVVTVARIFRFPVWKLERWVAEAGYVGRA